MLDDNPKLIGDTADKELNDTEETGNPTGTKEPSESTKATQDCRDLLTKWLDDDRSPICYLFCEKAGGKTIQAQKFHGDAQNREASKPRGRHVDYWDLSLVTMSAVTGTSLLPEVIFSEIVSRNGCEWDEVFDESFCSGPVAIIDNIDILADRFELKDWQVENILVSLMAYIIRHSQSWGTREPKFLVTARPKLYNYLRDDTHPKSKLLCAFPPYLDRDGILRYNTILRLEPYKA